MKNSERHRQDSSSSAGGFALIATISVMVLLIMVALAMLNLSTIELRSSGQSKNIQRAQANARLALMLAVGELQKQAGVDQRVTANASIRDSNSGVGSGSGGSNAHWLGVWDSREESATKAPDYDKTNSFRRWLVSSPDSDEAGRLDFATTAAGDMITLVGGESQNIVQAPVIDVGNQGKLAWWVGGENMKAMINVDELNERLNNVGDVLVSTGLPGAKGHKALEPFKTVQEFSLGKAITRPSLELLPGVTKPDSVRDMFHDITTQAYSLPVDVVQGGLKKDLNLLLERDELPTSMRFSQIGNRSGMPRWKFLHRYYQWPKRVQFNSSGRPTIKSYAFSDKYDAQTNPKYTDDQWVQRIAPVLVKQMLIYSYGTEQVTVSDQGNKKRLALRLYVYPILVLWNPYNVDLEVKEHMSIMESLPIDLNMKYSDGGTARNYNWKATGGGRSYGASFGSEMPGSSPNSIIIKAGHVKALYPSGTHIRHPRAKYHYYSAINDLSGYDFSPQNPGAPFGRLKGSMQDYSPNETFVISSNEILGDASDPITMVTDLNKDRELSNIAASWSIRTLNSDWHGNNGPGTDTAQNLFDYGLSSWIGFKVTPGSPVLSVIPSEETPSRTFAELEDNPTPFMVATVYLKPCDEALFPSKSWVNSVPTNGYQPVTDPAWRDSDISTPWYASPYSMRMRGVTSDIEVAEDLQLHPTDDSLTYFGSSNEPADGRFIIPGQQVPVTPLMSLGQLQHLPLGVRHRERGGQFQSHQAFANSFANPGIPADKTLQSGWWQWMVLRDSGFTASSSNQGWSYQRLDRSYIGNQALWDSWFFSSLASQNQSSTTSKSLAVVVEDFFQGKAPNSRMKYYRPLGENQSTIKTQLVNGSLPDEQAYLKAAKYCLIQGGFNVNSTSVEAWKAVLASTHKKRMAYLEPAGSGGPQLTEENTYPVSRALVPLGTAGDQATGGNSIEELRWRGYRDLTEDQLTELATAIVKQVKIRGPFRSLSEFVNRRLAQDDYENLSLYGALQAALEDRSVSINEDYYGPDKELSMADLGASKFAYEKAAEGSRYQGAPCYVTQADLLQNLAPVISVRGDSFVIRAYGDSRDAQGNILARAWCEATVQRYIDYVDTSDEPETSPEDTTSVNQLFGRQLRIKSFRWLSSNDLKI
jgi:hypothetical protein